MKNLIYKSTGFALVALLAIFAFFAIEPAIGSAKPTKASLCQKISLAEKQLSKERAVLAKKDKAYKKAKKAYEKALKSSPGVGAGIGGVVGALLSDKVKKAKKAMVKAKRAKTKQAARVLGTLAGIFVLEQQLPSGASC